MVPLRFIIVNHRLSKITEIREIVAIFAPCLIIKLGRVFAIHVSHVECSEIMLANSLFEMKYHILWVCSPPSSPSWHRSYRVILVTHTLSYIVTMVILIISCNA